MFQFTHNLKNKNKHTLRHFTSLRFFFISSKSITIILIFCWAAKLAGGWQLKCSVLWAQPAFSHFSLTSTLWQLHHSHPAVLWRLVTECQMCRFTSTSSQFLTKKPDVQRRNWTLSFSRKDMHGFTYSPHTDKQKKGRRKEDKEVLQLRLNRFPVIRTVLGNWRPESINVMISSLKLDSRLMMSSITSSI